MLKPKLLLGLCAVLALGVWAGPAAADPTAGPAICSSAGTAISGHYWNLRLSGNNYVAAGTSLTVRGDLVIRRNACLDAYSTGTVTVGRNVFVGPNAILGLGCAPGVDFLPVPCGTTTTDDTVGGNLFAFAPQTMYLTADTIGGNLISLGGGPGAPPAPFVNFPIKQMTIDGNAIIKGWDGGWFGFIGNTVDGSVVVANNTMSDPDANEVVTNTVDRNLICYGNDPAVQFGDSGGAPNVVSGFAFGECGFNVVLPNVDSSSGLPQPISVRPPSPPSHKHKPW